MRKSENSYANVNCRLYFQLAYDSTRKIIMMQAHVNLRRYTAATSTSDMAAVTLHNRMT